MRVLLPTERSSRTQRHTPRHRRRRNLWRSCSARFHRNVKIFAQPVGRSRPFSGRSLVLAKGRPMTQSRYRAGHGVRRYLWKGVVRWRALGGQRCAKNRTCGANHSGKPRDLADAVVRGHREAGTRSFQQFRDQNHGSERLEQREIAYLGAETGRLKG